MKNDRGSIFRWSNEAAFTETLSRRLDKSGFGNKLGLSGSQVRAFVRQVTEFLADLLSREQTFACDTRPMNHNRDR